MEAALFLKNQIAYRQKHVTKTLFRWRTSEQSLRCTSYQSPHRAGGGLGLHCEVGVGHTGSGGGDGRTRLNIDQVGLIFL